MAKFTNDKLKFFENNSLPKIVSLFCGAGGLDLGFKQERYQISLAIDFNVAAIQTHKKNFATTKSIAADLTILGPNGVLEMVMKTIPEGERIGIIGGPPCQGFSRANPSAKSDDPRNLLPSLYVEVISTLKTKYVVEFAVFENVLGIKDLKHSEKYEALKSGLISIGFDINEMELCALDFGVPQKRRRVIISAMRKDQGYSKVDPKKVKGFGTVREAIGMLPEPVFFQRNLDRNQIPEHPNHWTMNPKSQRFMMEGIKPKSTRSFRGLKWDAASPTIAFGNREIHIHPNGKRRLSIYEAMLIQGFPSTFVLEGNLSQQVTQISNAVPPPLARSIAAALKKSLGYQRKKNEQAKQIVRSK